MYLHQQLIDNLLLNSKLKILKLQTRYTYTIILNKSKNKSGTVKKWYNFNQYPNNKTKLQYQWYYYVFTNIMNQVNWNYIIGPTKLDQQTMNNAALYGDIVMFYICLENGINPDNITMNIAITTIEIFNLCLQVGLKPTQETMNYSAYQGYTEIFKLCLQVGMRPTQETMNYAVNRGRADIFKICLDYVEPDQITTWPLKQKWYRYSKLKNILADYNCDLNIKIK